MRILHYTLGLPPFRSGGLTKYATDLLLAQSAAEDTVSLLYPGDYTFWRIPTMKIIEDKNFKGVSVYEIKNPNPVPLLHGVSNPAAIYNSNKKLSQQVLEEFYNKTKPKVFHIHTLMGLPLELLKFFKNKGVKIIYSSHDYYGLCPKVNFINEKDEVCNAPNGFNCAVCNKNAMNSFLLKLRNSKYVLKHKEKLKGSVPISLIAKEKPITKTNPDNYQMESYDDLLKYYHEYFDLIDGIHFNSSVTKKVYEKFITPHQFKVIPISHSGIQDNRRKKNFDDKHIRIGFIGSIDSYKGFPMLKEVLCELQNKGVLNWSLQVWGGSIAADPDCDKIQYKGKYASEDIVQVYDEMDVLLVPSICKETFSLICLEALSYGVPVLVSENVGAQDIVKEYSSNYIISLENSGLLKKLKDILENPKQLLDYNEKILAKEFKHSMTEHTARIKELYININL